MYKKIFSGIVLSIFFAMMFFVVSPASPVSALGTNDLGMSYGAETDLSSKDPRTVIAQIIKITMAFLGIIAVLIILLGGFKWMTAQGNEEQVSDAQKIITQGTIGLIIVLSAWGIAKLVLDSIVDATS